MRTRVASAALLLAGSSLAVVGSAPPAGAAEGCYPVNFGTQARITSRTTTPVVTHAWNKVLAPGSSWSRTTTISKVNSVTAGVEFYANASAEAGKVIAKASVEAGVTLRAAGTATRSTDYSESVSISNSTSANREYVVFYGVVRHSGTYRLVGCSYSTYQIYTIRTGTWRSYPVVVDGTIRCDLAAPNSVSARAKALYCG